MQFFFIRILIFLNMMISGCAIAQENAEICRFKGENRGGERLLDASYAGCRMGAMVIPEIPVKTNVKSGDTVGDGLYDETEAFRKTSESSQRGAILVPVERYSIFNFLIGMVNPGESMTKPHLYFALELNDIVSNWTANCDI